MLLSCHMITYFQGLRFLCSRHCFVSYYRLFHLCCIFLFLQSSHQLCFVVLYSSQSLSNSCKYKERGKHLMTMLNQECRRYVSSLLSKFIGLQRRTLKERLYLCLDPSNPSLSTSKVSYFKWKEHRTRE